MANKQNKSYSLIINLVTMEKDIVFNRIVYKKSDIQRVDLKRQDDLDRLINFMVINRSEVKVKWFLNDENLHAIKEGSFDLYDKATVNEAMKHFKDKYKELQEHEDKYKRAKLEELVDYEYTAIMLKHIEKPMEEIREMIKELVPATVEDYKRVKD